MSRARRDASALLSPCLLLVALLLPAPFVRADAPSADAPEPFEILGASVAPGEKRTVSLPVSETFAGSEVGVPLVVIAGRRPGPTFCLTAGVHGDEVNGIEVVRRLAAELSAESLAGVVLAVPIVNPHGFRRGSRYLPDRRDLNRHFPGRRAGSAASRIAHVLFEDVVRRCDRLLDFHTGSLERTNLPHARGDLDRPDVAALARSLPASWVVLHHPGAPGTLRRAATDAGIAAVTFEVGGPVRIEEDAIEQTLVGVRGLLSLARRQSHAGAEFYGRSRWIRVDEGGLLLTRVVPGDRVEPGQLLGIVVDPIVSHESEIRAPGAGRILGMAWSQVVIPGFAAFHIALADGSTRARAAESESPEEPPE